VAETRADIAPGRDPALAAKNFSPHTTRDRTVRLGDNVIVERMRVDDNQPDKPQVSLKCDNGDYHFDLEKAKQDAPWSLTRFASGKRKSPLTQQGFAMTSGEFWQLRSALAAMEKAGKHTLEAMRFDDARGLLRIDYFLTAGNTPATHQLYVDPRRGWRLMEHRVETPNLEGTTHYTYGVTVGGVEFPTEVNHLTIYKIEAAPPNMKSISRLIHLKIADKTEDDFRLSAFGFPEALDAPARPRCTRWYMWLMAAAGLCAAASAGFAWLRRRQAHPVQGATP
jgi:hypothetical protein